MAENWYLILELEFDPPETNETVIAGRIEEKAKFWAANFNHFKYGAQYRMYHQNLAQIKADMIGPANKRKELAADACAQTYGAVDSRLRTIGRKGCVYDYEAQRLATRLGVSVDMIRKRADKLGIRWEKGQTDNSQQIYEKYYKNKPANAAAFDNMGKLLAAFGVDNLYDFLFLGSTIKFSDRKNTPCKNLTAMAKEQKQKLYAKTDSRSGTGSKLCGQAELTFKDEASKSGYDAYLEYTVRKKILDEVKEMAEVMGEIGRETAEEYIRRLTEVFRDRKLAEDVLTAFCKMEKLALNDGHREDSAKLKVCRCGCANDVSDGRKVCKACGLELEIECPNCGTVCDATVKVCKCGFQFENIDKALSLCAMAEREMEALEFQVASVHLDDAEGYWPKSKKVAALRRKLTEYQNRVGAEVSKMRSAMGSKRFFEARRQYQTICKLFPGYSDGELEEQVEQAIREAQGIFRQAQSARAEKEALELCSRAYELCADLPGVRELMAKYPPSPVSVLQVRADPGLRANLVSWTAGSQDRSIRYVLVRSDTGWVQSLADGRELYRGSGGTYTDKDIEPARSYYYNVFVLRGDVCSKGASAGVEPVENLFEIGPVSVTAGSANLRLEWGRLPKNAVAEISQVTASGEKFLAQCTSDSYLITGLPNDQLCRCRVRLAYQTGGRKRTTPGVTVSGTPACPPDPIDTLQVHLDSGDTYLASWSAVGKGEVRLYGSSARPRHNPGDLVALATLEREMKQLQIRSTGPDSCSFRYSGEEMLYVTAVAVKGSSGVFGNVARACKDGAVKIKSVQLVNGKIYIRLDPPRDVTSFLVLYRGDTYPEGMGDRSAARKTIPLAQYNLNSALVLDCAEEKTYYFTIFAQFRRDGEWDYSDGATCLLDNAPKANIRYTLALRSVLKGFRRESVIVMELSSDQREFVLPALDVISNTGSAPMFKTMGALLQTIPGQTVRGTLTVNIPAGQLGRNTFVKAFFHDEGASSGCQLRLAPGSSYKLN